MLACLRNTQISIRFEILISSSFFNTIAISLLKYASASWLSFPTQGGVTLKPCHDLEKNSKKSVGSACSFLNLCFKGATSDLLSPFGLFFFKLLK